jgi:hypothetical protein
MSYIMMKELERFRNKRQLGKEELINNYPFLEYASCHVLYHAEKAQAGGVTQLALVRQLQQPYGGFDGLRNFHDVFQQYEWLRYSPDEDLLYTAVIHKCYKLVQILLSENDVNVNVQGGWYGNALQAASYHGHSATVQQLLEKGANVNAQGGRYGNALQAASYCGDRAIVQLLLEKGADVNAQGGGYGNALQAASYHGHSEILQLLLEAGAAPTQIGSPGQNGRIEMINRLKRKRRIPEGDSQLI